MSTAEVPVKLSDETAGELRDFHADDYVPYRYAQEKFSASPFLADPAPAGAKA